MMMEKVPAENLLSRIEELQNRLAEAEQLIEAIKAGEVDAFAVNKNNRQEIFTLQSGDYAYRVLIEKISEGALNLSEDGLIVYTNNYFHKLLQLPYEEVISSSVFDFIHSSSKKIFKELFKNGLKGEAKGEINLCAGKKIIPVYASLTSLQPALQTVGMIVTDLTEKKKQEKFLEEKNRALENANNELQAFTYISSHDLQEPLRKIQTFATRILERETKNLSESGKEYFTRMQNSANRMQSLIDDLLAYSQANPADHKFEKINFNEIIEKIKEDLKEELKEKNAVITITGNCEVNIIRFQFQQLLYNLVDNALKFSNPVRAPHIEIKTEMVPVAQSPVTDKAACHIVITDNGIGFEPQYEKKIFELFYRLHGKHEYHGTGIGLAIVKKIIKNHKGIITATSQPNQGTCFDIYIPLLQ